MSTLHFTKEHEWLRVDGDVATCGITDFAQEQLGDVVYVELPEVGRQVQLEEPAFAHGIGIDLGRVVGERRVDLDHLATDWGVDLAGGLDRFHHRGLFVLLNLAADLGQLDGLMDEAAYQALVAEES